MVDTHCHIYCEYYDNISKLIQEIKKSGIEKIIVNGCDMKSNLEVLELVKEYDIVYGAIGFHVVIDIALGRYAQQLYALYLFGGDVG